MDLIIESVNETYIKVSGEPSIRYDLHDKFSFYVDGYQFSPKYKYGVWDGKIRLYNINSQLLPKGLLIDLLKYAKSENLKVSIDDALRVPKIDIDEIKTWIDSQDIYAKGEKIKPHWYQVDAVVQGLDKQRGLLRLPTSAGKSLIIALLTKYETDNSGNVLILVPTDILRSQMADDLVDYQLFDYEDIYLLKGKPSPTRRKVTITTWQTAVRQSAEWLSQFTMLLNDECHLATGKSLAGINEKMTNAVYKLGLTGTLKDTKCHIMQLKGLFGEIFAPISTREMIDGGHASEIGVVGIIVKYSDVDRAEVRGYKYQDEISYITEHKARNNTVAALACNFSDENVIVLFRLQEHGKNLLKQVEKKLEGTGRKAFLIYGGTKDEDREAAKAFIEENTGVVLVASYGTFSTGVSIRNLHRAIFSHPTKSKITSLQSLGRLLRKHGSKEKAFLYDIVDDLSYKKSSNYAYEHGVQRLRFYSEEDHELVIKKVQL